MTQKRNQRKRESEQRQRDQKNSLFIGNIQNTPTSHSQFRENSFLNRSNGGGAGLNEGNENHFDFDGIFFRHFWPFLTQF